MKRKDPPAVVVDDPHEEDERREEGAEALMSLLAAPTAVPPPRSPPSSKSAGGGGFSVLDPSLGFGDDAAVVTPVFDVPMISYKDAPTLNNDARSGKFSQPVAAAAAKNGDVNNGDIPDIIIPIFLRWSASDSQLAVYSKVCKDWRRLASEAVAQEAIAEALEAAGRKKPEEGRSPVRGLLITDMAAALVFEVMRVQGREISNMTRGQAMARGDAFCLAWFDSSGIQRGAEFTIHEEMVSEAVGMVDLDAPRDVEVCPEWRGFRNPNEVLGPFGYDEEFVMDVLKETLEQAKEKKLLTESTNPENVLQDLVGSPAMGDDHRPNFAVRGTTLARPEGHCLCLNEDFVNSYRNNEIENPRPLSNVHRMAENIDDMTARFGRRADQLLPRVVGHGNGLEGLPGIRFVNADGAHSTRFITPFFECGGVEGAVTMFLVLKTSEEGNCWVSGRNSRYEVGQRFTHKNGTPGLTLIGNREADDPYMSDEEELEAPFQCLCRFQSDDPFRCKHLSEDAPEEDRIHRACRPAGGDANDVRCYCAVFDGSQSAIRVDGEALEQRRISEAYYGWGERLRYDPERNGRLVGHGRLNGLSLGADHQFDYSLMYDLDGAYTTMYELAVFKGRMNAEDIEQVEQHLMRKHGIVAFP